MNNKKEEVCNKCLERESSEKIGKVLNWVLNVGLKQGSSYPNHILIAKAIMELVPDIYERILEKETMVNV